MTTRKMSPRHRAQAKSLAVSYHAYFEAIAARSDNGIVAWGGMLLADYEACGLTMGDPTNTRAIVEAAKRRLDEARLPPHLVAA